MIDRLGEINRILLALRTLSGAGPLDRVPLHSAIQLCRDNVLEGRLPDHDQTVRYVVATGMALLDGEHIQLTDDGLDFLSLNSKAFFGLTSEQARVLARKHYLGGTFQGECRAVFKSFSWSAEKERLTWSELDDAGMCVSSWVLDHLCQLELLTRTPGGFETHSAATAQVMNFVEEPMGLTEEKLRQLLREKEAVGDIGEALVTTFERERLGAVGGIVESHCVRRVSQFRVNAGYDIESFDGQSTTGVFNRFIEVKAARGAELRFFWTENEMKVAEQLRARYWIYFQGGIDAASRSASFKPLMFRDPIESIINDAQITKSPQGFLVQSRVRGERR